MAVHMPLARSGQAWINTRRDEFEVFFIQPTLEAAEQIARGRGGRKITAADLDDAEMGDLPIPPMTEGDGRE